jgi:hypothetical protein
MYHSRLKKAVKLLLAFHRDARCTTGGAKVLNYAPSLIQYAQREHPMDEILSYNDNSGVIVSF